MDRNYIDTTVPITMTWCVSGKDMSCNHDNLDPYIAHIQGVFGSKVTVSLPTNDQIYNVNSSMTLTPTPWLYGNLDNDDSTTTISKGYWTSFPLANNIKAVTYEADLSLAPPDDETFCGIRSVITIVKSLLD